MTWPDFDAALYTKLANDAGVAALVAAKIFADAADALQLRDAVNEGLPYIVFNQAGGGPGNAWATETASVLYRVDSRHGTRAGAATLHAAVYAALHKQTLTISGWANYWLACERQQSFIDEEGKQAVYRRVWDVRIKVSEE
jgi:hypothetical protein